MQPLSTKLRLPAALLSHTDQMTTTLGEPIARCWVALSGGVDSCVLLHVLKNLPLNFELAALHINHQISPNAMQWQVFCEQLCEQYQIPLVAEKVQVENQGRGIEDAARDERYKIFQQHLKSNDVLLFAHHADDQAETFLLRLMRGAGPKGLSAMTYSRHLGLGKLYRPMLAISRSEIVAYAQENNLEWVEDESNQNHQFSRNYLRNEVLPLLESRWPEFRLKVQQSADLCAQSDILINELAQSDFATADERDESVGKSISLIHLRNLSPARRQNLLRFWLEKNEWPLPELSHFNQIEVQLINGCSDAEAQVNFGGLSLRVFRQQLFALPLAYLPEVPESNTKISFVPDDKTLTLAPNISVNIERLASAEQRLLRSSLEDLSIQFRRGGERAHPQGRVHSQTLKNLFQEYEIEPWLRHVWPLIYSGEQLVAVPGLWVCHGFAAENELGLKLTVSFR